MNHPTGHTSGHRRELFLWRALPWLLLPVLLSELGRFRYPFESHGLDILWELFCLGVAAIGVSIQAMARENEGDSLPPWRRDGIYQVIRHPMSVGRYLVILGLVLFVRSGWLTLGVSSMYWLVQAHIMARHERQWEQADPAACEQWSAMTPPVLPRWTHFAGRCPNVSSSMILEREYPTILGVILAMTAMEVTGDYIIERRWALSGVWMVIVALGLASYATGRRLRRRRKAP